jgi:copper transport protein
MRRYTGYIVSWLCILILGLWPFWHPSNALAHALPESFSPTANAVLSTPPANVTIRFSEQLNRDISRIVVVNPSNEQVDNKDSHVEGDGITMTVSLPLLAAGTYVVAWRSHSADDGHIAGGSYIFHIARSDGIVPPLTGPLPNGNIIGGAGAPSANGLDTPNFIGMLARFGALLAFTVLSGLFFWWRFILPRQPIAIPEFAKRARLATEIACETILVAAIIEVAAQAVALDGTGRAITSLPLLGTILFHSQFGAFILLRAVLSVLALVALGWRSLRESLTVRNQGRISLLFIILLTISLVYSGHGGTGPAWASFNDGLHLLANGIWLGGLFALAFIILPAFTDLAEQGQYLARSVPAFSVPAILAVAFLLVTGPLNTTQHVLSINQLWTTPYGITLSIKIALFILMIAISAYHAFRLRPQLAAHLQIASMPTLPTQSAGILRWLESRLIAFEQIGHDSLVLSSSSSSIVTTTADREYANMPLVGRLVWWLRIEAAIGITILFCAALLSPLSATLAPPVSSNGYAVKGGAQSYTQVVDGLQTKLSLAPGHFGTNDFTLVVTDHDGNPVSKAQVFLITNMVEMDMGTNTINLIASSTPGTFTGQGELPMAGHWHITAVINDGQTLHRTTFTISASFS